MPNVGRGTYEPPGDDVHIFDGTEEDDDIEGSRLPLLIVIALFVLAAFAGVVWLAYTQGVARGHSEAPRIITAQKGPAKVAANGEEGATPYKGLKIYEQAAPADEESGQASPPAQKSENTETPETTAVTSLAPGAPSKEPPLSVAKSITPPVTKPAEPPPQKPAAEPVQKPVAQPVQQQVASAPPAQLGVKTPAAVPVSAPAPAAAGGSYFLQIGAYKSQAEADSAWKTYRSKHGGALSGYAPDVKMVDLGAKGTWYRLRVSSFADKNAAAALCTKLTAEGGACFPAK